MASKYIVTMASKYIVIEYLYTVHPMTSSMYSLRNYHDTTKYFWRKISKSRSGKEQKLANRQQEKVGPQEKGVCKNLLNIRNSPFEKL